MLVYLQQRAKACSGASQTLTDWYSTQGNTIASAGTSGGTSNAIAITFNVPGATTWGNVTSFGIFDSLTGGQLLYWGPLAANKSINSGDPAPSFPIGTLQITED
jgi:hypothetical protein